MAVLFSETPGGTKRWQVSQGLPDKHATARKHGAHGGFENVKERQANTAPPGRMRSCST